MKKILAVLLVLVMSLSTLTGCGTKNEEQTGQTEEIVKDGAATSDASATSSEIKEESTKPITIKIVANLISPENTLIGKNTIALIEEKFNVKLEFEIPPSANYGERLQLTFVSGDLPDVILFDNAKDPLLKDASMVGTIIPINQYLETANYINEYTLESTFNAFKLLEDEKVFGIPRSTVVRSDGLAIRKDWLENLGIELTDGQSITLEQFNEINRRFTTDDPDGNGIDDTYGLAQSVTPNGEMVSVTNSAGSLSGVFDILGWQKATDEPYEYMDLRLSQKSTKFKEYLQYLQDTYKSGYFDPEWPVLKNDQLKNKFLQGTYGMMVTFPGHVDTNVASAKELNPNADMIYLSGIVNPEEGKVVGGTMASGAWGGWTITKSAEHPQLIVDIFNYMLSDEFYYSQILWGGEGVGYEMDGDIVKPLPEYIENGNGWNARYVRRAGDAEVFLSLTLSAEQRDKVRAQIDEAIASAVPSLGGDYVPAAALEPSFIDYSTTMNDTITQIILGELSVDAYDEALAGWYEKGGTAYVEQMNAYIKNLLSK